MNKKLSYVFSSLLILFFVYLFVPTEEEIVIPSILYPPTEIDSSLLLYNPENLQEAEEILNDYLQLANVFFQEAPEELLNEIAPKFITNQLTLNHIDKNEVGVDDYFILTLHENYSPFSTQITNDYLQKQMKQLYEVDRSNEITLVTKHPLTTTILKEETSKKYHFYHEDSTILKSFGNKVIFEVSPELQKSLNLSSPILDYPIYSLKVQRATDYEIRQSNAYQALTKITNDINLLRAIIQEYFDELPNKEAFVNYVKEQTKVYITFNDGIESFMPEEQITNDYKEQQKMLNIKNDIHHQLNIATILSNPYLNLLPEKEILTIVDEYKQLATMENPTNEVFIDTNIQYNFSDSYTVITNTIHPDLFEGRFSLTFNESFAKMVNLPSSELHFHYSDHSNTKAYKKSPLYLMDNGKKLLKMLFSGLSEEQKKNVSSRFIKYDVYNGPQYIGLYSNWHDYYDSLNLIFSQEVLDIVYEEEEMFELIKDQLLTPKDMQQITYDKALPIIESFFETKTTKNFQLLSTNKDFLMGEQFTFTLPDVLKPLFYASENEFTLNWTFNNRSYSLPSSKDIDFIHSIATPTLDYNQYWLLQSTITQAAYFYEDKEELLEYFYSFSQPAQIIVNYAPELNLKEDIIINGHPLTIDLYFDNPITTYLVYEHVFSSDYLKKYPLDKHLTISEHAEVNVPSPYFWVPEEITTSYSLHYEIILQPNFEPFELFFSEQLQEKFSIPTDKLSIRQ